MAKFEFEFKCLWRHFQSGLIFNEGCINTTLITVQVVLLVIFVSYVKYVARIRNEIMNCKQLLDQLSISETKQEKEQDSHDSGKERTRERVAAIVFGGQ